MGLVEVHTDKRGFSTPVTPVSSGGMLRFAKSLDNLLNNTLNGEQVFRRPLLATPTTKTISAGAITPTLSMHKVSSESGTSDNLDTITAVNNTYLVLTPTLTHTITLRHGVDNIYVPGGNDVVMASGAAVMLFCEGGTWSHIGTYGNKNNFTATRDPLASDNNASYGYVNGSLWLNTQRDRLWICVDNGTASVWKRVGGWSDGFRIRAAADTILGIGVANPTVSNTAGELNDSTNTYAEFATLDTSGELGGWTTTTFNLVRLDHDPIVEFYIKSPADALTTRRMWVGLTSATMTNSDTASGMFIGFRYSSVAGDAGWIPVMRDGTTQSVSSAIGTISTATAYKLRIQINSNNAVAYFNVNDGVMTTQTTGMPAITSELGVTCMTIDTAPSVISSAKFASCGVNW